MASGSTSVDYKPDLRRDKTARPAAGSASRTRPLPGTNQAAGDTPLVRPADSPAVEEFLQLLARAVRQFHTYPATSRLCTDAIAACHRALASLDGRDRLAFRITPRELIVDEIGMGAGTIVEHELVHRLHRAYIAAVDIDRRASARDLSRFCADLVRCDHLVATKTSLLDLLAEHGVDTIVPQLSHRPEVLQVGAPRAPLADLVERERARRQAAVATAGPVSYLYPPDKGWVRLDPSARFEAISLVDLAILVDDPAEIATMLMRLTDDEPGAESRAGALQQKFSDVSTLFASLDPRLARVMFSKLARAVLELEPDRRKDLLRRTILPGLLDGRADGTVLRDFPNVDLAESLCLLLDLETAAPGLLTTALDRLEVPADRRREVAPLLEARLRGDVPAAPPGDSRGREPNIDRHARRLIEIAPAAGKSFAEFADFDLSIDGQTTAALDGVRASIAQTDVPLAQLQLLLNLVRLEPNPTVVAECLRRSVMVFAELERTGRADYLAACGARFRQLAEALQPSRPDVSDAISNALTAYWTLDRAMALSDLYAAGAEGRAFANGLALAFGVALVPAFVTVLDDPAMHAKGRGLVSLACEQSRPLAPALAARLGSCGPGATRAIVWGVGGAGPGYERALAGQLEVADEPTCREALHALARIGSTQAAAIVGVQLRQGASAVRAAAEEALWHFPPAQAAAALRELLVRREFIFQNPQIALRLIDRAAQAGVTGLEPAMRSLVPLRFRVWNPALVRIARKAQAVLRRP